MLARGNTLYPADGWGYLTLIIANIRQALASIDAVPSIGVACDASDVESSTLVPFWDWTAGVSRGIPAPDVASGDIRAPGTLRRGAIFLGAVASGCCLVEWLVVSCERRVSFGLTYIGVVLRGFDTLDKTLQRCSKSSIA